MNLKSLSFSTIAGQIRRYLSNPYLWAGLAVLLLISSIIYFVFNSFIMPSVTLHGESITVPEVVNYSYEDAAALLEENGLRSEQIILRKPNLPRDVVIDQSPRPNATVKPGRRIYLSINAGDTTTVQIPNVESFPIREARSRITVHGLLIEAVLPDSIPSPHANTITRQSPPAGTNVPAGTGITLWYGTGLGDQLVSVPDVTGKTVAEARKSLIELKLRSIVLGEATAPNGQSIVVEQGTAPGTSVKQGFEIRLYRTKRETSLDNIDN